MNTQQIEDLARPFLSMRDSILAYYDDPEIEAKFQTWRAEYGNHNNDRGKSRNNQR